MPTLCLAACQVLLVALTGPHVRGDCGLTLLPQQSRSSVARMMSETLVGACISTSVAVTAKPDTQPTAYCPFMQDLYSEFAISHAKSKLYGFQYLCDCNFTDRKCGLMSYFWCLCDLHFAVNGNLAM